MSVLTKLENYQILLNKISHRFLQQPSYLVGERAPLKQQSVEWARPELVASYPFVDHQHLAKYYCQLLQKTPGWGLHLLT